jgi:proline iminopeptidase/L-proline amide hydrolase
MAQEPVVPPADRALRVPVQGGEIYVRVNGDLNGPKAPLLLVHGGPGGACWQMFPALPMAVDRAVVVYDQLDSGRSDAPNDPANWTIARYADEIEAVRAALGIERFHLLGHSWGGILAARYAADHGDRLRSLTLQGTPLSSRQWEVSVDGLLDRLPDGQGEIIRTAERTGAVDTPEYGAAVTTFFRTHINRTRSPAYAPAYMHDVPDGRGDALAMHMVGMSVTRMTGALDGFDETALLDGIAVPTLLLNGELDVITPETTRALLPRLQAGTFAEIAGAGHMAQFDKPEDWLATVNSFVSGSDPA